MCGIAGVRDLNADPEAGGRLALQMANAMVHRGPDGGAVWHDPDQGIALSHRRLAIIDLTEAGAQPMRLGPLVIAYNGEIYNHRELAAELSDRHGPFRSSCDTEVVLAAIMAWGLEGALARFIGMFAFGVWDERTRQLQLARDRIGKKPLYYGRIGGRFLFASELTAIMSTDGFTAGIDHGAFQRYCALMYVPNPSSILDGFYKLAPGHVLTLDASGAETLKPYWNSRAVVQGTQPGAYHADPSRDTVSVLDELLQDAVGRRLMSDVPLGGFLSGGTDSSLVTALMARHAPGRVRTFSIGFRDPQFDEAPYARAIAKHLGSQHEEIYIGENDLLSVATLVPGLFDEPFADSSQIPTYLVSKLARSSVTVCLSGDGGDELFCGYTRYLWLDRLTRFYQMWPLTARRLGAPVADLALKLGATMPILSRRVTPTRRKRLVAALKGRDWQDGLGALTDLWPGMVPFSAPVAGCRNGPALANELALDAAMREDIMHYLPDDILTKLDRTSMSVSLEARAPLLDHRVVEFALNLPLAFKYDGSNQKIIERQLLARYLPPELFNRPKKGFSVPLAQWLRGPLRDWCEELLSKNMLSATGLYDVEIVRQVWDEHVHNRADHHHALWTVLAFQTWYHRWRSCIAP